jgi:hypothetical protein
MSEMVDRDQEHLRLLALGYYILSGMTLFFTLFTLLYIAMGIVFSSGLIPANRNSNDDPRVAGYIFLGVGIAAFVVGLTFAVLYFAVGRSLRGRRHRTFCLVMAGLSCLYVPWGTALGICSIIVLVRPEVQGWFEGRSPALNEPSPS